MIFSIKKIFVFIIFLSFFAILLYSKNNSATAQTPTVCSISPADVVLAIDRSGSMNESAGGSVTKLSAAKTASNNFLDILAADTDNRAGLVTYAATSTLNQTLTNNFQSIKTAVNSITANGGTCIECGVFSANQDIKNKKRAGIKNVVILLTDGKANYIRGNSSRVATSLAEEETLQEVTLGHTESQTIFFTIGLGSDVNALFLQEIASITGGKYYASPTSDQLNSIYNEISQIIAKGGVSGVVFNDENGNSALDSGESNLPGWNVQLEKTGSQTKSQSTDANGSFSFTEVCDGNYTLRQTVQSGWSQTLPPNNNPYTLTLTNGNSLTSQNFGNKADPTPTPLPSCVENLPTLEVTPDTQIGQAGEAKNFEVKVTNNDSSPCQPSTFDLSAVTGNSAWDLTLADNQLSLEPGQSKTTTLTVTPPSDAVNGPQTITVYAQRPNDSLLSSNIRYVVDNPLPTPTPTPSPEPTSTPVPTSEPSATPTPTLSPTPTPTPQPNETTLAITIGADGIGTTQRIPIGGNKNPLHPNRNFLVQILRSIDNASIFAQEQTFTYSASSQKFEASFNLPAGFSTNAYNIYVEGPRYLRSQYPGSALLTGGQANNAKASNFHLIAGDINKLDQSFNRIDLSDYNILISCSIYSQDDSACNLNPNYKEHSDLDDNGIVDEDDYTLWLKEVANQDGVPLPGLID